MLLVALIFLILLTLLAIGASSGSLLQQRMVAATRSAQLAQMSADTALRGAEWYLWSRASQLGMPPCGKSTIDPTNGCVEYNPESPLYAASGPGNTVTQFRAGNNAWLSTTGIEYKGTDGSGYTSASPQPDIASPNVAANPRYIIEDMGRVKPPGAGPQCESGVTGCNQGGAGTINVHVYRITARATGGNQNVVRVAQSTFDAQASN